MPVASFPAWASPYGVLDLYGDPVEWTDGAPKEADGKKSFPVRGAFQNEGGLWIQRYRFGDGTAAFRCARACTWREGTPLPVLQPPVDTEAKVDAAYVNIADVKLRAAFDAWRAARAKKLGEGAVVSFREPMVIGWAYFSNYVREEVGDSCMEGPIRMKYEAGAVTKLTGGAVACCGTKCPPPSPAGVAQRWLEAQRAGDYEKAKAFVPPKGYTHESRLNGSVEKRSKVTPEDPIHFRYLSADALECDESFDDQGTAQCRSRDDAGDDVTVKLKKTKTGAVVTGTSSNEVEGC